MSTIHNSEPQAFGLIKFTTTFGELELELFTKQCPKITRNFVQLCLDGYYNGTIFDRVEKDFIAVGGKFSGAENPIETDKQPDEFHSRLRFSRRGLLATANTEKDANGPEFFLTLGPAPELQSKHSIFGRLRGDSVYHLVDLNECPVDEDCVPLGEKKILETVVEENPFPELEARPHVVHELKRLQSKSTSEDESERTEYLEPKLSIKTSAKKLSFYQDESDADDDDDQPVVGDTLSKDEAEHRDDPPVDEFKTPAPVRSTNGPEEEGDKSGPSSEASEEARQKRLREIKEQIQNIKRQIEQDSATKIRTLSDRRQSQEQSFTESVKSSSSSKQLSVEDPDISNQELRLASKKGRNRERETLELMESFKKKLKQSVRRDHVGSPKPPTIAESDGAVSKDGPSGTGDCGDEADLSTALELVDNDAWLGHRFEADDGAPRDAKDANQRGDDWYSIDDPRNPIVQRVEADKAREYKRHRSRDNRGDVEADRHRRHSRQEGGCEGASSSSSRDRRHNRSDHHKHRYDR